MIWPAFPFLSTLKCLITFVFSFHPLHSYSFLSFIQVLLRLLPFRAHDGTLKTFKAKCKLRSGDWGLDDGLILHLLGSPSCLSVGASTEYNSHQGHSLHILFVLKQQKQVIFLLTSETKLQVGWYNIICCQWQSVWGISQSWCHCLDPAGCLNLYCFDILGWEFLK